jgi:hypothetical protein
MKRLVLSALFFFALTISVFACPICDTETGQQVRESIFGEDFGRNVLLTLAPVPVLLGIMALVFRAVPDSTPHNKTT